MFVLSFFVMVGQSAALFGDIDLNTFSAGSVGSKIIGSVANANQGRCGGSAGDFNGDGIDDFYVTGNNNVLVLFSKSGSFSLDAGSFTSSESNGVNIIGAGTYAARAGDFNGDGFADIVCGDAGADPSGRTDAGIAYVFFGRSGSISDITATTFTTSASTGFRMLGASTNEYLGGYASPAGDVNGDGLDDVALACVVAGRGAGYIVFGRRTGIADIDMATLVSTGDSRGYRILGRTNGGYGVSLFNIGDFNHDGYDDVYVGGPYDDTSNGGDTGAAFVIFGHSNATAFPDLDLNSFTSGTKGFMILGAYGGDTIGNHAAYAGDFNGDGVDDMIHGSYWTSSNGRYQCGMAWLIFGDRHTTSFSDFNMRTFTSGNKGFRIIGGAAGDNVGSAVTYAGDVNGDGMDDVMVGAGNTDPFSRLNAGAAYVIYGRRNTTAYVDLDMASFTSGTLGFRIFGAAAGDFTGDQQVGYAGDVNADGTDDIFVGAPLSDPSGRSNGGTAYIIYGVGPPTSAPTAKPTVTPSTPPTVVPTVAPSCSPSTAPTAAPTTEPTTAPSAQPSVSPTGPSSQPSVQPSSQPSRQPSSLPSSQPSVNAILLSKILSSPTYKVKNGFGSAVVTGNGSVYTWGEAPTGGDSSSVQHLLTANVTSVVSTRFSFAALKNDGSVVPWGVMDAIREHGADAVSSYFLAALVANEGAYAGIDSGTGGVRAFGSKHLGGDVLDESRCGGCSQALSTRVASIAASAGAFAAMKVDGTVFAWGNKHAGADVYPEFLSRIVGARLVVATRSAFAVLLRSGGVVAWGDKHSGGDASAVEERLSSDVLHILAARSVFVAFKKDSSIVVWGYGPYGGDASSVSSELASNVTFVAHTYLAAAALKTDGSVVAWGKEECGGDASAVQAELVDVVKIYGNSKAFAALTSAGKVVAWGKAAYGGQIPSNKMVALSSGVLSIYHTDRAFAALKTDGSVVVWGQAGHGGSPGAVEALLVSGVHTICSNDAAFSVIKTDGSVVGWGHPVSVPTAGVLFTHSSLIDSVRCA